MEDEISDGVKILCERMESNPEEFLDQPYDPNTFDRKLGKFYYEGKNIEEMAKGESETVFWFLSPAEKQALVAAYVRMIRTEHTRVVVERLLDKPEPEPEKKYTGQGVRAGKSVLTKAQMTNESLKLLNESFDEAFSKNHETDSLIYKSAGRYAGFLAQEIAPLPFTWNNKK